MSSSVVPPRLMTDAQSNTGRQSAGSSKDLSIWFDTPATTFTQSLPLGNGRLGAMVFGGIRDERIILNEGTLWSGSPQDADRPDAASYLPEIRRLLIEGKNAEAEALVAAFKGDNRVFVVTEYTVAQKLQGTSVTLVKELALPDSSSRVSTTNAS